MPVSYVPFDLQDGYIHDWLVAGPQAIAVQGVASLPAGASKAQILGHFYAESSGIERLPVEPGPLDESTFRVEDYEGLWATYACAEDHFVDLSARYPSCHYLRGWAYTELDVPDSRTLVLGLTADGPADVWLNGAHVHRGDAFGFHSSALQASLRQGANELLVRFEHVGSGACRHRFALKLTGQTEGVQVRIPTAIEDVAYRNQLASLFNSAYTDRDVFTRDETITVHWPGDMRGSDEAVIRLQTPDGRIYAEHRAAAVPGQSSAFLPALHAPQGPLRLRFLPRTQLFYDQNVRVERQIALWGMGLEAYSEVPFGIYPERRLQALQHAMRGGGVFAEIAKMALGQWAAVETTPILAAIDTVNRHEADAPLFLVALLGMLCRWGEQPDFPAALKDPIETCLLGFRGWDTPPAAGGIDATAESTRILLHTSEILAGQLLPDRVFAASGRTGQWHRERGERMALVWLRHRGTGGFAAWDSPNAFEAELVALAHLMDLSETEAVWQLVTVTMDKLLFTLALNTYRGVFGATQGAADVTSIKGGLLAATAGISRLLWGQGVFNHHLAGVVSMACMEDYQLPPLIPDIAMTSREELWNRECHVTGDAEAETVNKVTYRTPDFLLASAQDYHPGEPGGRQHVWQATLGPEAVVYTTHPACVGRGEGHAPGFWLGNATLPRVAQWKDVLIAIYDVPEDDWMGYTHAYFPTYAFDAHALLENAQGQAWAFAQKGEGYVAITASQGLSWITQGPAAYRELRSYGHDAVWCCQMGRAAWDGDFEAFQERVLSLPVVFDKLVVRFDTLRGETLTFGWEGPILRNGEEVPLSGFRHYENPYCVTDLGALEMEIRSDRYLMRLKFG
ncbi:MAG: hypothetical protein JXC32_21150 [Anaerolineae bacterium]|nr:hypothetical protein [Anaerolineae bacterium]